MSEPHYGKYRGIVTGNQDPEGLGRIKAKVPDVLGDDESGWALPALPYAGDQVGLFLVPPVNASVWIEFEHGDADYPVWSGCFWTSNQPPVTPATADKKVLKTDSVTITLDDTPGAGGLTLETSSGQKITLTATSIKIDNGSGAAIELSGPTVKINDQALEVT
jgi:uncharacterized protein involved in type VI secretion and phage assembly